jgi:3-hydroxybutyryl-CoA dehydrogenase
MNEQIIGVVGAGVMGTGVAQNLAQTGHEVALIDREEEALQKAREEITQAVRFRRLLTKSERADKPSDVLARIRMGTDLEALAGAVYVIENVTENWEVKREVYAALEAICAPACIFAANTSAIPITRIGSATRRPAQVIGIHFMNPVPQKEVVEVIRGVHTSDATLETTRALLGRMGKRFLVVNDSPGFVSNRVLMLTINEATFLLHERVADAETVDQVFKSCFGHPMGPLETADLIGLDTILNSLAVLYESFNDSKFRPCPLLKQMVDAGFWGRKNGRGFYTY